MGGSGESVCYAPDPIVDYRMPAIVGTGFFQCDLTGVAGTTPVFVKATPSRRADFPVKFEARVGIAIFGTVNDPECHRKSPFDDEWFDNYVRVVAYTRAALLRKLQEEMRAIQDGLWA